MTGPCIGVVHQERSVPSRDFDAFVREQWLPMVRTGVLMGLDTSGAEDVAQDCLVVLSQRWSRVAKMDSARGYAYRTLMRLARKELQRRRRQTASSRQLMVNEPQLGVEALDLLRGLTREERAVVILRHYFSYTETEIAQVLGMRLGTVKSKNSRALIKVRRQLSLETSGT